MESFGARLKRERQQRKIELDDISASTKISTRFLRALEEEQFDQLPGGIFNKGFVRAYARHMGIDEDQAIADYLAAVTPSQPEAPIVPIPEPPPKTEPPVADRPTAEIPWGLLALALVVMAFGLAMWGFYSQQRSEKVERPSSAAHARKSETNAPNTPAPSTGAPSMQAPATQPAAQQPAAVSLPSALNAPSNTSASSGRFSLVIKAREDSWVFIDADGKQVMHDLLVAPAEKPVDAEKEIVIRAGNIGGLDFSFNGKKLASQGDYGEVKTLTFTADGLQPPAPASTTPAPVPH
jgi:cytoskeleton protein RodZ